MQITITGHHVEITDGIREAVNNKLAKLNNHFPDIQNVDVIVTVEKNCQIAEANTHFLGKDFSAKASNEELYKSIAEMSNKLTTLLQRQKELVKAHPHQKPATADTELDLLDEDDEQLLAANQ
ncbi:ribosome-associated translation inhibitor RaiA [Dasania sp. GY-MA-18]|uniref:Ribosome hibernation promoting factor n=1 Tax=Dasania phycosphaerae TaxID=2950436 RepID=A0A9J6RL16_9GAMM|nr:MULTISPECIES: ribosome-associated translation inhibitor RaiA [Dasania]MCR8922596.1 ribosome-associated translation inhibitor RaiA [Dasania sp. GY-MA-18]MCZ0865025.1 ribosome-associated translation inhibitor RaiA [Dasania phycosphaerae]MCZ0868752.1 ribosome-associated translation inhibitor RaiA [Dasania phycosphaerae]